jgi:DNA polymerase I-like protein with 3'-5' exonuclease and polymerase domains
VHLVLQVHDELVFDAPADVDPRVINHLKLLMESAGSEYGMTTPVDVTKIVTSWDEGKSWRPKIKQPTCKKSLKHSA